MKQREMTLTATTKLAAAPTMTSVVMSIILHSMFLNFFVCTMVFEISWSISSMIDLLFQSEKPLACFKDVFITDRNVF
jgi:hypothetical protein